VFADRRALLSIPNFDDDASNLPFAVIGIWGLIFLLRPCSNQVTGRFLEQGERWPYLFVFVGEAASELCLKIGDSAVALLKSSQVMILRNQIQASLTGRTLLKRFLTAQFV
jgi:hypothetical protein